MARGTVGLLLPSPLEAATHPAMELFNYGDHLLFDIRHQQRGLGIQHRFALPHDIPVGFSDHHCCARARAV